MANPLSESAPAAFTPDLLQQRTSAVETQILEAWEGLLRPEFPEGLALLAVGGFGRRELFPCSDIDLMLLVDRQALAEKGKAAISAFLQVLWDRGLRMSHSVHTPQECAERHEGNLELTISLLDERFLLGDRTVYAKLGIELPKFIHGQREAIARELCGTARERQMKAGASIYQLEPNLKESPGGLRDYQLLGWLEQLRHSTPAAVPRPEQPQELAAARRFLFALRHQLHTRIGRDTNVLTFDLQDEVAEQAGQSPAAMMREFYGHARDIFRAASREIDLAESRGSSLLVQFRDWRSRVSNADFHVSRERVYIRAPHRLEQEPLLVLQLFQFVGRHGIRLAAESERRIDAMLPALRAWFAEPRPQVWPEFKQVLATPDCALALRSMHETGVLGALLPGWEGIDCLVIRDFYHRYTVDEHTLVTVQNLEDLRKDVLPERQQFSDLLSEVDEPELLVLALLCHDLGKAVPDAPHVAESVRLAGAVLERLCVPAEQRRTVRMLIDRHLEFSNVMTSRDLDDPGTARTLADRAGTLELAKKLTLLTYADIDAVNPTALSPWRAEQLWRVYLAAYRELTRELETDRITQSPDRAEFLEGFPARYLRTHSEADIELHLELDRLCRERGVALEIGRENGFYRLTLVAHDRPFLLTSLAGALAGFGMNILKAEGFANRHGTILDTFVFSDPHRTLELNPQEVDRLRLMLEQVARGKVDVKTLLRNRPKPSPPSRRARIRPAVAFDSQASELATLIEVVAQDRPGLLYDLTSAISGTGANIELVLIDTEAHKALDVFYVTAGGAKLTAAQQQAMRERLLAVCG